MGDYKYPTHERCASVTWAAVSTAACVPAPATALDMRLPGLLALMVLASVVSLATSAPFKHLKMKKLAKLNLLATLKNKIMMKKLSPFVKFGSIATKKLTPWVKIGATASNVNLVLGLRNKMKTALQPGLTSLTSLPVANPRPEPITAKPRQMARRGARSLLIARCVRATPTTST